MSYFPPYIDASGIHMPTCEDKLKDFLSACRTIFGQEAELSPAVPDYQPLSVFAKALDDTSALLLAMYNSRNPLYASGPAAVCCGSRKKSEGYPGTDLCIRRLNSTLCYFF